MSFKIEEDSGCWMVDESGRMFLAVLQKNMPLSGDLGRNHQNLVLASG
jgi:hypothetical protein